MRVRVYAKRPSKCPVCKSRFDPFQFWCPNHHDIRPYRLLIQITGVKDPEAKDGRIQINSDLEGVPLTPPNTKQLVEEIERRIAKGTFRAKDFLPQQRDKFLISRYTTGYLDAMKARTEIPQGEDGWLSQSGYSEIEKYTRLYIRPIMGSIKLNELRRADVMGFLANLKAVQTGERASSTIKKKARDALRHMVNYAINQEDISPLTFSWPKIEKPKRVIKTLDREQQESILDSMKGRSTQHTRAYQIILRWAVLTGRRVNEYRAMKVCDVSLAKREYKVVGAFDQEVWKPFPKVKSRAGAAFPMDDEMVDVVREALADRVYGPTDFLFVNPETGAPYTHHSLRGAFDKAKARLGYDITMNEFGRHSWATQKIAEGWSFSEVAMFLLDAVSTVENNYANVTKATRRAVLELKKGLDTSRTQVFGGIERVN